MGYLDTPSDQCVMNTPCSQASPLLPVLLPHEQFIVKLQDCILYSLPPQYLIIFC